MMLFAYIYHLKIRTQPKARELLTRIARDSAVKCNRVCLGETRGKNNKKTTVSEVTLSIIFVLDPILGQPEC